MNSQVDVRIYDVNVDDEEEEEPLFVQFMGAKMGGPFQEDFPTIHSRFLPRDGWTYGVLNPIAKLYGHQGNRDVFFWDTSYVTFSEIDRYEYTMTRLELKATVAILGEYIKPVYLKIWYDRENRSILHSDDSTWFMPKSKEYVSYAEPIQAKAGVWPVLFNSSFATGEVQLLAEVDITLPARWSRGTGSWTREPYNTTISDVAVPQGNATEQVLRNHGTIGSPVDYQTDVLTGQIEKPYPITGTHSHGRAYGTFESSDYQNDLRARTIDLDIPLDLPLRLTRDARHDADLEGLLCIGLFSDDLTFTFSKLCWKISLE